MIQNWSYTLKNTPKTAFTRIEEIGSKFIYELKLQTLSYPHMIEEIESSQAQNYLKRPQNWSFSTS